jgi:hypothetical protein
MGRNPKLLTHKAAAKQLGVTPRWLTALVRQGKLRPAFRGKHVIDSLYDPADIRAILELRGRTMDMPSVAHLARQAAALSSSVADRLSMLCQLLGLDNRRLAYEQESMFQIHAQAYELLLSDLSRVPADQILEWATIINAIDESYLRLLEDITDYSSPWEIYMQLANRLADRPSKLRDMSLPFAYSCLEAARKSLRHVAYFYVLERRGQRMADALFVDKAVTDEVISQLYPRRISLALSQIHDDFGDKESSGGTP